MSPPLVLASKSAARAALLTGAGLSFETAAPGVDEEAAKAALIEDGTGPREIADALAEMKALKVSRKRPGALVIGADQTLDLGGTLMDKAPDLGTARAHLVALRGQTHVLHAAVVAAVDGQPIWRELKSARLRMRDFSDDYLDAYLGREGSHVLGSVGCYRMEGEGVQLFDRVDGDHFTILGLPMLGLLDLLRRYGVVAT
jgi:septum formation protein